MMTREEMDHFACHEAYDILISRAVDDLLNRVAEYAINNSHRVYGRGVNLEYNSSMEVLPAVRDKLIELGYHVLVTSKKVGKAWKTIKEKTYFDISF